MNHLRKGVLSKLLVLVLAISICLAPAAQALTAPQLKVLLKEYYLDGVSDAVLSEETIEGILEALDDPYTEYLTAEEYQSLLDSLSDQEIAGIGITASTAAKEEGLFIVTVHDDSPAKQAGLLSGDIITSVDGKSAAGQSAETITSWIRGEIGTKVSIQVLREDGRYAEYTLTRKLVVVPSTTSELINDQVCYINCKTFGPQTLTHFQEAMKSYSKANIWMIDLRSNLGGEVNAAAQTLGLFIGKGSVAYLRDGQDKYVLYSSQQDSETMMPTIVLTSQWTASASEIFSGVVRDKDKGLLVGERTFGKGVAQVLLDAGQFPLFFPDGDAMKITAFRYFTAAGSTADQVAIIPHVMVSALDADEIAMLLTHEEPKTMDRTGFLRLHLGNWRWYLDLKSATSEENQDYFTRLLEAIPPGTMIKQGTKTGDWVDTTVEDLVSTYKLTNYTSRSFTDVGDSDYEDEINTLATYSIVKGNGDGTYSPDASMTRAELSAILAQALGLPKSKANFNFTDVEADAWYVDAVNAAYSAGLMEGIGEGAFWPEGTVTEEQLITVVARVSTMLNAYLYEDAKNWDASTDQVPDHYSAWAQQWVWLLSESQKDVAGDTLNLIYEEPGQIDPGAAASREEAAALLYNVLTYINVLPV